MAHEFFVRFRNQARQRIWNLNLLCFGYWLADRKGIQPAKKAVPLTVSAKFSSRTIAERKPRRNQQPRIAVIVELTSRTASRTKIVALDSKRSGLGLDLEDHCPRSWHLGLYCNHLPVISVLSVMSLYFVSLYYGTEHTIFSGQLLWLHYHHHNQFYGTTRVSRWKKRTSGLYGARED